MKKYLFLYWTSPDSNNTMPSPEEMQEVLKRWGAWKEKFKAEVVDMGDGLKPGGKTLKGGQVTDGPHPEVKEIIGGYSVIEAESLDKAMVVARECPMALVPGAAIEVREMANY